MARLDSRKPMTFSTRVPSTHSQIGLSFDSFAAIRSLSVAVPGCGFMRTREASTSPSSWSKSATLNQPLVSYAKVGGAVGAADVIYAYPKSRNLKLFWDRIKY